MEIRRTAVVTGAGGGIGAEITRSFLTEGHNVIAIGRSEATLTDLAGELGSSERLVCVAGDVSRASTWEHVGEIASTQFDGIEILVNNAAVSPRREGASLSGLTTPPDEWEQVLAVNLTGAFFGIQAAGSQMRKHGWGRIVNITSIGAREGSRLAGIAYGASKSGLTGLTKNFARELAPHGITVNAVAPGRVETPLSSRASAVQNAELLQRIPIGRFGTPDDIAAAVSFLASERAGWITGVTLDVNGGAYIAP